MNTLNYKQSFVLSLSYQFSVIFNLLSGHPFNILKVSTVKCNVHVYLNPHFYFSYNKCKSIKVVYLYNN